MSDSIPQIENMNQFVIVFMETLERLIDVWRISISRNSTCFSKVESALHDVLFKSIEFFIREAFFHNKWIHGIVNRHSTRHKKDMRKSYCLQTIRWRIMTSQMDNKKYDWALEKVTSKWSAIDTCRISKGEM